MFMHFGDREDPAGVGVRIADTRSRFLPLEVPEISIESLEES